ncbi:glycosyltransferase family 4 protein [Mucilaginibacter ginkgonis]|uniref:Glycosyltransferase family 4 protein n=1 Tax=Mucilaginibacter ginkgonis TaxID=2682091 RepID=A0A6I4HW45_9SPHI|nr:glycosyltransferase family 1 protein [Mucilaginibacter ginkgonis]QQL50209.1 glycosyltransferase family 4 protein [Mucilaginibacter ginkgonis]
MERSFCRVIYDTCIFNVQKVGGISVVFCELINRLKQDNRLSINFLINGAPWKNLFFSDASAGVTELSEFPVTTVLLPFFPLLKLLPSNVIFHSTYQRYCLQSNVLNVLTIHDLGYEKGIMRRGIKRRIHLLFKGIAIKRAHAIVCVSANTKKDLIKFYPYCRFGKEVRVIHNGVHKIFLNARSSPTVLIGRPYLLYVGARFGYKNFKNAVLAAVDVPDFDLRICGGGHLTSAELRYLERLLPGRFFFYPDIATDALRDMYSDAFCLLYLSDYEGFGIPILEAMACKCPVIALNNSSIPEISGGAALLIDDSTPVAVKKAISLLDNDDYRQGLINKGLAHARKFTWEKAASEMADLYLYLKQQHK